jgi:2-polyprenyl-6-methoxyphenol hydroxylase-like FAD-dependent oxidoreductase
MTVNAAPTPNLLPSTATVLIVGAGPVGLAAAVSLVGAGIDTIVLDRLTSGANTSRAAVVQARTLEVLDQLGLTKPLHTRGIVVPRFTVRDHSRTLVSLSFIDLPTAFPYTLMIPQDITESVLAGRLSELGGRVHRGYDVATVAQNGGGAQVTAKGQDGKETTIQTQYVIAADGMHSVVRDQVGIGFSGAAYENSFVLADVRMDWPVARDEVALYFSPEGVTVVAPLPGDRFRVVATVAEAPEHTSAVDIEAILRDRGPQGLAISVHEVVWASRFRVHHRVADRFRAGSVFLAGDAAHVHSPAGGQGMNTGIQDAVFLAGLLADVIGGADASVLDRYEATRRPIAIRVVAFTDRMTRVATLARWPARMLRNIAIPVMSRIPALRRKLIMELSELNNR